LRAAFKVPLAENGRDPQQVIEALADAAEPGLMGNTGSNFFGWVMGASSPVGMAADLLTAAWGQNAAIYQTSPAAAMAEEAVAQWLLDVLDLPRESSVGFTTGATMSFYRRQRARRCCAGTDERRRRASPAHPR
jgi:glutamate/tyrosine decarboxylase-like PLP-dependent enzyme